MANVNVMGGITNEGGLKAAQAIQRRHNAEVADALLNISGVGTANGQPVHKDDARPAYQHQQFPKMLYRPLPGEEGEKIVLHQKEMDESLQSGWQEEPYPRVQIAVLDPATEKAAMKAHNDQLAAQLIQQNEAIQKMMARLEAIDKKK